MFSICRELVYWHLNQIQFKNPGTQILTLKNMTPNPFITFIYSMFMRLLYLIFRGQKTCWVIHYINVLSNLVLLFYNEFLARCLSSIKIRERWSVCNIMLVWFFAMSFLPHSSPQTFPTPIEMLPTNIMYVIYLQVMVRKCMSMLMEKTKTIYWNI